MAKIKMFSSYQYLISFYTLKLLLLGNELCLVKTPNLIHYQVIFDNIHKIYHFDQNDILIIQ